MRKLYKLTNEAWLLLQSMILYFLSFFIRRDNNAIALGSWTGKYYSDNSRYLAEFIVSECEGYRVYWVGNKECKNEVERIEPRIVFLEKDRFFTNLRLLKCRFFFFTQLHFADISQCNIYRKAVLCYLHHGMPLKKWGEDGLNSEFSKQHSIKHKFFSLVTGRNITYDFFVTSSEEQDRTNLTALKRYGSSMEKNIHSGTPRNDMLFNYNKTKSDQYKTYYCEMLGIPSNAYIIMYLPTFRRTRNNDFSFFTLDRTQCEKLDCILAKKNAYIIEKSHFANDDSSDVNILSTRIKCANKDVNLQEMLLFTDVVISDYSGAFLDFLLLNRPIIHFAYDYEFYKDVDSGLYYTIDEFAAGRVVKDFDELCNEINNIIKGNDDFENRRRIIQSRFMGYERGQACQIIVNEVIRKGHMG